MTDLPPAAAALSRRTVLGAGLAGPVLLPALLPALLSGCARLLSTPAPVLYTLDPPIPAAGGQPLFSPPLPGALAVRLPDAPQSLDTARIALRPSPQTLDYFANAAWSDRAPVLVQRLMVATLERSRGLAIVGREDAAYRANRLLALNLLDFEARYGEGESRPPVVSVHLDATLVALPDRHALGQYSAQHEATAARNDVPAIVAAFQAAAAAAAADLAGWTLRRLAQHPVPVAAAAG